MLRLATEHFLTAFNHSRMLSWLRPFVGMLTAAGKAVFNKDSVKISLFPMDFICSFCYNLSYTSEK